VAGKVAAELKSGWNLRESLDRQPNVFPPLVVALTTVGEESGTLPEVMAEMEKYYVLQQRLQQDFWSQIRWPLLQLLVATLVIAMLILVLGSVKVADASGLKPLDPLGFGLVGASGAIIFLSAVAGAVVVLLGGCWLGRRLLGRSAWLEGFLLRVPLVGRCLRALAVTRFALALHLMLDSGVSVARALQLALLATDNAAFLAAYPKVEAGIQGGHGVAASLARARLFPQRFLGVIAVAEESGQLPEALRYQAAEYDEDSRRRLTLLTQVASGLVWLLIAVLLIATIFRMFDLVYLKNVEFFLNQYLDKM
jgi:type II secretory pathway component PulF